MIRVEFVVVVLAKIVKMYTDSSTSPLDVMFSILFLSIKYIELDVDNLHTEVNLAAKVAKPVTINMGCADR